MLDRRKLAAPVLAQAVSFVVVLVIGGLTGHSTPQGPPPASPSPHVSASPPASATPSGGAKEHQSVLTVQVPIEVATGGIVPQIPVRVLDSRPPASVAAGTLTPNVQDTQLGWSKPLPAGTYQVCAQAPAGLRFTERSTGALPGWTCTVASVAPGSQTLVTFHLAPGVP
jgi:hypothetical protein